MGPLDRVFPGAPRVRILAAPDPKNLIGSLQLAVFPFQHIEAFLVRRGQSGTFTRIPLSLTQPLPQCFRRTTHLARNRRDRRPLRVVLPLLLQNQPHSWFTLAENYVANDPFFGLLLDNKVSFYLQPMGSGLGYVTLGY
jgi:hypothetical protein